MKVSPDGHRLALVQFRNAPVEVFDFNAGTGTVSSPRQLTRPYTYTSSNYGVEFSPSSQLLYGASSQGLTQYDLPTGRIASVNGDCNFGALQLGPDNKIYQVAGVDNHLLDVVQQPDQLGAACVYQRGKLVLPPGSTNWLGLPTILVTPPSSTTPLISFGVVGTQACQGETSTFTAALYPAQQGGHHHVGLWRTRSRGRQRGRRPKRGASLRPAGHLPGDHGRPERGWVSLCLHTARRHSGRPAHPAPSFGDVRRATHHLNHFPYPAGRHDVSLAGWPAHVPPHAHGASRQPVLSGVLDPQHCAHRDSLRLTLAPAPTPQLGPDRAVDCNEPTLLDATSSLPGSTYRWQDGSTQAQYAVTQPGRYTVTVTAPPGCAATSSVTLTPADCQLVLPTIITPNGDGLNDRLVVRGLVSGTYELVVYNRWGQLVYQQAGYRNSWEAAGLADGLYYYAVTTATGQRYQGWVEVLH